MEAASRCLAGALDTYHEIGDVASCAHLLNNLGLLALEEGRLDDARTHLTKALALNQSLGDWSGAAVTLGNLALAAYEEGDLQLALQHCTEAIEDFEILEDAQAMSPSLNLRGLMVAGLGN